MADLPVTGKDFPWSKVEEVLCKVLHFLPLATVIDDSGVSSDSNPPYALLTVKPAESEDSFILPVNNLYDFALLWLMYKEPDIESELVAVAYAPKLGESLPGKPLLVISWTRGLLRNTGEVRYEPLVDPDSLRESHAKFLRSL